jgi:hypothetical protein
MQATRLRKYIWRNRHIPLHEQRRWRRENRFFIRTSTCCLKFCCYGNIKHFLWTKAHEEHLNKNTHVLEHMSASKQTSFYWPVMPLFICKCTEKNLCLKIKTDIRNQKALWQLSIMQHLPTAFLVFYELGTTFVSYFTTNKTFWENLTHPTFHDAGKRYKLIIIYIYIRCIHLFKTYTKTYIHSSVLFVDYWMTLSLAQTVYSRILIRKQN